MQRIAKNETFQSHCIPACAGNDENWRTLTPV
jgi:hypothetical protein